MRALAMNSRKLPPASPSAFAVPPTIFLKVSSPFLMSSSRPFWNGGKKLAAAMLRSSVNSGLRLTMYLTNSCAAGGSSFSLSA